MRRILKRGVVKLFYFLGRLCPECWLRPYRGKAAILVYHRVMPEAMIEDNPFNGNLITPTEIFAEQMEYISRHYKLISMEELPHHLAHGEEFAVAVTFDDGYKDNLDHALPILKQYGVPATIYVTTRFLEGDCQMWWYELPAILMRCDSIEYELDQAIVREEIPTLEQKRACFARLRPLILSMNIEERTMLIESIRGAEEAEQYPELCLNWEEVFLLDNEQLITIGAHTHSHESLAALADDVAWDEMRLSKDILESRLGHRVEHFAFPYGTRAEADIREYAMAESLFGTATTAVWGMVDAGCCLHQIPRVPAEFSSAEMLEVKLKGWEAMVRLALNGMNLNVRKMFKKLWR